MRSERNLKSQLMDEIELLDGASADFDMELVTKGELSPVFFGSALTNFGVETFLQHFLKMTYAPTARQSDIGMIDPFSEDFFCICIQNSGQHEQKPQGQNSIYANLLRTVYSRHGGIPCAGRQEPKAFTAAADDGR